MSHKHWSKKTQRLSALGELAVPGTPIWPIQALGSTGNQVWLIGSGGTPFHLVSGDLTASNLGLIGDPTLSPDETTVIYSHVNDPSGATLPTQQVHKVNVDNTGHTTLNTQVPSWTANHSTAPCWSPDGSKIIFVRAQPTLAPVSNMSIMQMNADGTGVTTLVTLAPSGGQTNHVSYSPSGNYICYTRTGVSGTPAQIWVMQDDGTSPTKIYDCTNYHLNFREIAFPAWQRNADVLGFCDINSSGTSALFRTINYDGTGLTTIYNASGGLHDSVHKLSWLSDDSALICRKRTNGTTLFNATDWELSLVDGGGGGVTDTGISMAIASGKVSQLWVAVTSEEAPRIMWRGQNGSGEMTVESVLEDLSDQRVDFDASDYSPIVENKGIYGRNVN